MFHDDDNNRWSIFIILFINLRKEFKKDYALVDYNVIELKITNFFLKV